MKNLDIYLSNLAVGNFYLHNLHWNVKGLAFKQVHEYLEDLYDGAFEKFDAVAELQKMQGVMPKSTLKDYEALNTLQNLEAKDYTTKEAIELALKYVETMRKLAVEIREEADEKDNFTLVAMMEDHVADYDKEIWFMQSMLE